MVPASRDLVAYRLELLTQRLYLHECQIGGRVLTEKVSFGMHTLAQFADNSKFYGMTLAPYGIVNNRMTVDVLH